MSLRRKFAVAATAVTAAVALPIQAGAAHASTPEEDLSACIATAVSNMAVDTGADPNADFGVSIDDCVNTFLRELGVDPSAVTDVTAPAPTDDTTVNTAVLGTADASADTSMVSS